MSHITRTMARRQIENRLGALPQVNTLARPAKGWIKAIREALGMPATVLAKRMGVSQPRIVALEDAEAKSAITLESLERAARALGCELAYVLKPIIPLEQMVENQAMLVAQKKLSATRHSMALEAQSLKADDDDEQTRQLAKTLIEKSGSKLWDSA